MILPDYLQDEVLKYCMLRGIPWNDGNLDAKYVEEIQKFIKYRMKNDRNRTRLQEEKTSCCINNILDGMTVCESPIEEFLYNALKENNLIEHCRPQFEIGTKRVDFAFPIAKLAVECDGRDYHFTDKLQIERDQERDKYLAKKGWRVIHLEGVAIRRNIALCIDTIKTNLGPFLIT